MPGDEIRSEFTSEEPVMEKPSTYEEAPTRLTGGGMEMGPHHYVHCRDLSDDAACSLIFAGYEKDIEPAATHHLATHHRREDTGDLRTQIREAMKKIPPGFFH